MKGSKNVNLEGLATFFVRRGECWTDLTRATRKKKEIDGHDGRYALIRDQNHVHGAYVFGKIKSLDGNYFSVVTPNGIIRIPYGDVQELIVENR